MTRLFGKGYNNYWSNTTCVYGAIWTSICSLLSMFSLGNADFCLIFFKIVNLVVHMGNAWLLYKISKKKVFSIIYGLNPFILIECLGNVHNDIYMIFFVLLAFYELLERKNIILSILFLAIATDIKYFAILLLPLIVIYHYKDKSVKIRLIKCLECGILFLIFAVIPYLLYLRDLNIFAGVFKQNRKLAKGLYLFIYECYNESKEVVNIVKLFAYIILFYSYLFTNIKLLIKERISFNHEMKTLYKYMLFIIFFVITNFQPWYFAWLMIFIIWQKLSNIKFIVYIQLMTLFLNMIFLTYSENILCQLNFFILLVISVLIYNVYNKIYKKQRLSNRNKNIYNIADEKERI